MRTYSRLVLAVFLAASCLAVLVSTAGARRLELSEQHIRAVWLTEPTHFKIAAGFEIDCPVSLEGSFHSRTLSKVCGQLIGYITQAVAPIVCEPGGAMGEIFILNGIEINEGQVTGSSLPWHVRFNSFSGVLPRITGIRVQIINASFLASNALTNCLYVSSPASPLYAILEVGANGEITHITWDGTQAIPLHLTIRGGCMGTTLTLSKPSDGFEVQGRATRITVRLVQ